MINHEQIRAARAILDWSTNELAKITGLTVNGINKIERGHVGAHKASLDKIQSVFEEAGLEFLPGSGVRRRDRIVETYEGEGVNQRLLDDIYSTLKDTGGEVLIANVDESKTVDHLTKQTIEQHLDRLKKANITERLLVRKGDVNFLAPPEFYHAIPEEYFSPYQFYVYGQKLALMSRTPMPKVIIINDGRFVDCVKKLFNYVWERTERPTPKKDV
ncbi:MAG: hypothetical protein PHD48_00780 [Alphaproteobacteria bacterium]|nr:hypothetical protein [Alphaproteobacteria bacterium]